MARVRILDEATLSAKKPDYGIDLEKGVKSIQEFAKIDEARKC